MWTGLGGLEEKILKPLFLKMSDPGDINLSTWLLHYIENKRPTPVYPSQLLCLRFRSSVSLEKRQKIPAVIRTGTWGVFAERRSEISTSAVAQL